MEDEERIEVPDISLSSQIASTCHYILSQDQQAYRSCAGAFFVLTGYPVTLYPPKLHEVISQMEAMIGSLFCLLPDSAIKGFMVCKPLVGSPNA